MATMDIQTARNFENLIRAMNIPQNRRAANEVNMRWFLRNALVDNRDHPNLQTAMEIARQFA